MNKARGILQYISKKFDLPSDILAGIPRIELLGTDECSVEPHQGLLEYGDERIAVGTAVGPVVLEGKKLEIKRMNGQRITLSGRISQISLTESSYE